MGSFLGFVFGAFRGFVMLGVFVILGQLLRLDGEHWWRKSVLMPYGESVANGLRAVIGEDRVRHAGRPTSRHGRFAGFPPPRSGRAAFRA